MTINSAVYRIREGFRNPDTRMLAICLAAGDLAFIALFILCAMLHLWALGIVAVLAYAIVYLLARSYMQVRLACQEQCDLSEPEPEDEEDEQ